MGEGVFHTGTRDLIWLNIKSISCGPEQAKLLSGLSGSDGFDNARYEQSVGQATGGNQGWIPNVINIVV